MTVTMAVRKGLGSLVILAVTVGVVVTVTVFRSVQMVVTVTLRVAVTVHQAVRMVMTVALRMAVTVLQTVRMVMAVTVSLIGHEFLPRVRGRKRVPGKSIGILSAFRQEGSRYLVL